MRSGTARDVCGDPAGDSEEGSILGFYKKSQKMQIFRTPVRGRSDVLTLFALTPTPQGL